MPGPELADVGGPSKAPFGASGGALPAEPEEEEERSAETLLPGVFPILAGGVLCLVLRRVLGCKVFILTFRGTNGICRMQRISVYGYVLSPDNANEESVPPHPPRIPVSTALCVIRLCHRDFSANQRPGRLSGSGPKRLTTDFQKSCLFSSARFFSSQNFPPDEI